jgi:hypothetical protein
MWHVIKMYWILSIIERERHTDREQSGKGARILQYHFSVCGNFNCQNQQVGMQWSTLHTPTGRPNKFRLNCLHVGVYMPIEHSTILGCFKLSFPHLHTATCKIPSTTAAQQRYLKTKQDGCDRPATFRLQTPWRFIMHEPGNRSNYITVRICEWVQGSFYSDLSRNEYDLHISPHYFVYEWMPRSEMVQY